MPILRIFIYFPVTLFDSVQAQNSTLAGLPVSSSSPNLRFSAATVAAAAAAAGGTMMMVDPLRQQQQQQSAVLHPAFSGGSIPGGLVAEKLGEWKSILRTDLCIIV